MKTVNHTFTRYEDRKTRFLGYFERNDWCVKVYTISIDGEPVDETVLEDTKSFVVDVLRNCSLDFEHYNIATMILHKAREGYFLLVNEWVDENMLAQQLFLADFSSPLTFKDISDSQLICCVWEMQAINFDRDLWVREILTDNDQRDMISYLAQGFSN